MGVGAQRSGTTWWFGLITEHPGAHAARKEQHFFDRFTERPFEASDAAAYAARFPRPGGAVTGEWTPRYMHDFWTPALLRRAAPDARLLVLLRDPWARYLSGVAHEARALRRELRFGKRLPERDDRRRRARSQPLLPPARPPVRALRALAGAGAPVRALLRRTRDRAAEDV